MNALRTIAAFAAVLVLSACGGADGAPSVRSGERVIGSPDAPVEVIEYASGTCGACAYFHNTVFPELKRNYVDTGQARFIIREFPHDTSGSIGFLMASCVPDDKYEDMLTAQFEAVGAFQDRLRTGSARYTNYVDFYADFARAQGMSRERFQACISDEDEVRRISASVEEARKSGVTSTPTFFVNGEKHVGVLPLEQFSEVLEAAGAKAPAAE